MQSKISSSILCLSLLTSFAVADVNATSSDNTQSSELNLANGGGGFN